MCKQGENAVLCPCMHGLYFTNLLFVALGALCLRTKTLSRFGRRRELSRVALGDSAPGTRTSPARCQWHAASTQIEGQRGGVPTAEQFHRLYCQCRAVSPSKMALHTREEQVPHLLQALAPESDRKAKKYGHTNSGRT